MPDGSADGHRPGNCARMGGDRRAVRRIRPTDRLLQPAIRYATEGYPVSEVIADAWTHGEDLFESDHAREAYLFGGESPTVGQRVTLPRLGESLALIAEGGRRRRLRGRDRRVHPSRRYRRRAAS